MISWKEIVEHMKAKWAKERQGLGGDMLFIGYTGFRTFVDPRGQLHNVLQKCREAKIMLANPFGDAPGGRLDRILHPAEHTGQNARSATRSIEYLKSIRNHRKDIRLKLYQDAPFLKLLVLGDHIWIQYYQTGLERRVNSEYVFKHEADQASLYAPFYQYFWSRWNDPRLPEYDLESDELIYRDPAHNEEKRKKVRFPQAYAPGPAVRKDQHVRENVFPPPGPRQIVSSLLKALFPLNGRQSPGGG
jgi:hypothetical protein